MAIPKIIAIIGPTASGKTHLAITLAQAFGGEIVSADSRQIYSGMDIGTAKPSQQEMGIIPHYLIDIKYPNQDYTVAEYKTDAIAAINTILSHKKIPLLVGGTGLYIKTVLENLDIPNAPADPALRAQIEKDIAHDGLAATFERLIELDPEAAYVVDPKNPRRVVRALEVALSTGKPFTSQRKKNDPLFDALTLGFNPPATILRERIDQRVDEMMNQDLVQEVKTLIEKYGANVAAFDAIGYREIIEYLNSTISLEEAVAAIKINTWHYAKRQMTWFKRTPNVHWIKNEDEAHALVKHFLK